MCPPAHEPSHIVLKRGWIASVLTAFRSDLVLVWKGSWWWLLAKIARVCDIPVANVDTTDADAVEYGAYCSLVWKHLTPPQEKELFLQQDQSRFEEVARRLREQGVTRACVFGTGPSLEKAFDFDFDDCLTIVCNSIVQSEASLNHIGPAFLCAGDVVSHYGVSLYAAKFREDLVRVLTARDLVMIGTAAFGYLLVLNHPEIRHRVILIEQTHDGPNYDLLASFTAPKLDSILNIAMLPLAATFAREIWLLGCDGRSTTRSNEDFWAHAREAQYHDLVESTHQCHPTFQINREQTTYARYDRSIEETISRGEREHGILYRCLQPSNTPALSRRVVSQEWLEAEQKEYGVVRVARLSERLRESLSAEVEAARSSSK